jgi:serine protease Do
MKLRSTRGKFLFAVAGLAFIFLMGMGAERIITRAERSGESDSIFPQASAQSLSGNEDIPTVVERAVPAVVNISLKKVTDVTQGNPMLQDPNFRRFFGIPREQVQRALGSGVIVSGDGYILTNNHLVSDAKGLIDVYLPPPDNRKLTAEIIGVDPRTDIAVLKVDAKDLPVLKLGSSSALRLGETVLAIGYPFQVGQTVTMGIVSGLSKTVNEEMVDVELIQTDAAINPGNSGGALINTRGELVGINNMIVSNTGDYAGIGFAIPIDVAQSVMEDLIKHGRVIHGYLGIKTDDLTADKAEFFGVKRGEGAIITSVEKGSPAMKAGVKANDIVTAVNGKETKNRGDLRRSVSAIHPGEKAELQILREGKSMSLSMIVAKRPDEPEEAVQSTKEETGAPELALLSGVGLSDLTSRYRQALELPDDVNGVLVTEVESGSPAEEAGLVPRDVIMAFNLKPVANLAAFKALVKGMKGEKFMLTIYRRGEILNPVLKP